MSATDYYESGKVVFLGYSGMVPSGLTIGKEYSVDLNGIIMDDEEDRRRAFKTSFKLAERNPMPELEAGMAVECRSIAHGYTEKYIVCGDMLISGKGDWNRTSYTQDGSLEVLNVWSCTCCHQDNWFKNLGTPIWQRSDNLEELEQLAELKKTISDASETIADAQKQASILEDALNGRQ